MKSERQVLREILNIFIGGTLIITITAFIIGVFCNAEQIEYMKSLIGDIGVVKYALQIFIITAGIFIAIETISETKRQNAKRDWMVLYSEQVGSIRESNRRMYQYFVSRSDIIFNEFYGRNFIVSSKRDLRKIIHKYFKSELQSFEESDWLYEQYEGIYENEYDFYSFSSFNSVLRICVYHDLCYDGFFSDLSGILFEIFNEKMPNRTIDYAKKKAIALERATENKMRRDDPDLIEV